MLLSDLQYCMVTVKFDNYNNNNNNDIKTDFLKLVTLDYQITCIWKNCVAFFFMSSFIKMYRVFY